MAFRTKLDYSDNRQLTQRERTSTTLSGTTVFGVPFSALTSGPDLSYTAQTSQFFNVVSTYSGNSATTIFTWGIPNVSIVDPYISALTPSNSGVSQNIDAQFAPSSSTTIDGNLVNLTYSGVSAQNLYPITMVEVSPGNYSGSVFTDFFVFTAETLDFTGRTIWIDNTEILRTKKLIVSNNPQPGYVLTCVDSEGMVEFQPASGSSSVTTYWSASTGTNAIVTKFSDSIASGTLSIAEGSGTTASAIASHAEGYGTTASGQYTHSEGFRTIANAAASHAEGYLTTSIGRISHAEGLSTTTSGFASHAEGEGSRAIGNSSHAEGSYTIASGNSSHSEGQITTAIGQFSHAEGRQTTAVSDYSHTEGFLTITNGLYSHAEGFLTIASGTTSHSEGLKSVAIGEASHSEGTSTTAIGDYSHAEGQSTIATGVASHSEGFGTRAFGAASHSGGNFSFSYGDNSFVHGYYSVASGATTIVFGDNITGTTANTVYVPDLIIDGLTSTDLLATDANGKIIAGFTSDIRLKKNIVDLPSALDVIKNLRGVAFEYIEESNIGSGIRFGFIAQEVQEIVPELVRVRPKSDGMLSLSYTEIIPWVVEAIKELTETKTVTSELILETQTIAAEDNNIELNYNGTKLTAIGGGISIINGVADGVNAEFKLNSDGNWVTNNSIIPAGLVIPNYTPTSSVDNYGNLGEVTVDNDYLYIKGSNGWKRLPLELF